MVPIDTLRYLASQKRIDADTLYRNGRNAGAAYLIGYSLELSLKRKISITLNFSNGFPETRAEFASYHRQIATYNALGLGITLGSLSEIRNHDLSKLLTFSGAEYRITTSYYSEWLIIKDWNPESRYKRLAYSQPRISEFMNAAKTILNQIS